MLFRTNRKFSWFVEGDTDDSAGISDRDTHPWVYRGSARRGRRAEQSGTSGGGAQSPRQHSAAESAAGTAPAQLEEGYLRRSGCHRNPQLDQPPLTWVG